MPVLSFQSQTQNKLDSLLRYCAEGCSSPHGLSSMSCSAYDTAWVSMITKEIDGVCQWLFPSSFNCLLETQSPDGGWGGDASDIDPILNTMAALLSLKKHQTSHEYSSGVISSLQSRVNHATAFLNAKLQSWDVGLTDQVGFELPIPTHLRLLEQEGISFTFPGWSKLQQLNQKKLGKARVEILYEKRQTTMTHSLEAFVGKVDFTRLKHLRTLGSMMASPSSTAAYLIYGNEWDNEAEMFIRSVLEFGHGKGSGAVPSAFPSTTFESVWVVSTLLQNGTHLDLSSQEHLGVLVKYIRAQFDDQDGLVGFAPTLLPDADDTEMAISTLNLAGIHASPTRLIEEFKNHDHFLTYRGERNPSFSANCNILKALLSTANPETYVLEIELALRFLYKLHGRGELKDKWNSSPQYPRMLLTNALARLIHLWDKGFLADLSGDCIHKAPLILSDIVLKTLQQQQNDGSWHNGSPEVTAYALLTLASASNTPVGAVLSDKLRASLVYGRAFLEANIHQWDEGKVIWVEKVSYGSSLLSQAYCIAAVQAPTFSLGYNYINTKLMDISQDAVHKFTKFYSRLPLFSNEPHWRLRAALVEGSLWLPQLKALKADIFPREDMEEDKYLEYIPQTWTTCNALNGSPLEPGLLWEMMIISMLNYQVDEFFESVVGERMDGRLDEVRSIICRLCEYDTTSPPKLQSANGSCNGENPQRRKSASAAVDSSQPPFATIDYVEQVLCRFTAYILTRPAVLHSPASTQRSLRQELKTFMLAHLTHFDDNKRRRCQNNKSKFTTPNSSYYRWVHSTSADHTSCPYSFQFFCCLIAYYRPNQADDSTITAFRGVRQQYLAEAMCRHLATMCRQYNDYGSVARDLAEENLNSVNFPEFWDPLVGETDAEGAEGEAKADLMWIAEYERECCMRALDRLAEGTSLAVRTKRILKTFVDVTDLYGQIYVVRDIASRMR
ncbi:hypothetical protein FE257_011240 [Aspergillus nanangensis]|uniref:Ent-kaurene synthase n=1 Tax=Aspergillus nanangensis TaxID=2582783 RepID=A0AAD4GRJ1_ASPNN|nr:hypothetical protein FE257_011240 [Aspergillus nanangensis]